MSASTDESSPATRVATPVPKEELKTSETVSDSPTTVVADLPPEDVALANASLARKIVLMAMFSAAQFLDVFNNRCVHTLSRNPHDSPSALPPHSALFPAIPDMSEKLSLAPSETVWIVSAYQLTFASFLLVVRLFPSSCSTPRPC
jgi:hypothetical protein